MVLPLIVLDNTPYQAKDENHAFSVADLMAWEKKNGKVPKGSFVALRTDMYKDFDTNPSASSARRSRPGLSRPSSFSTSSAAWWRPGTSRSTPT